MVDALHPALLKVCAGVALGEGDELVPFRLGAVGAAEYDEAPLCEVVLLERVSDSDSGCGGGVIIDSAAIRAYIPSGEVLVLEDLSYSVGHVIE